MTTTNVTPQEAYDGLVFAEGYIWAGSTITYSVPGAGATWAGYGAGSEPFSAGYSTFDATQAANFVAAVEIWDSYIASAMNQVSDATPGQIRVAFTTIADPNVGANANSPPPPGGSETPVHGDIWVDDTLNGNSFAPRSQYFELLMHELGHTLGLKHPFEGQPLPAGYDSTTYTIMSYTHEDYFYTWSGGGGSIAYSVQGTVSFTPMVLDIAAIQEHYGADTATGAGDTTYIFTDGGLSGRQAIYDRNGIDTLDLSALSRGSTVDLRPGAYSDLAYYSREAQIEDLVATYGEGFRSFITGVMSDPGRPAYEWTNNLGIAFSTVIENVIGSSSADDITGNSASNDLRGGNGNDTLRGGLGGDHLFGGRGADVLIGGDGSGIDYARYDDADYGNLVVRMNKPAGNTGAAAGDIYSGIEGIIGGVGNDTIFGNGARNYLLGGDGNDKIRGGGGNDYLVGGAGGDSLYGGLGGDEHIGGDGTGVDYARYDDADYGNLVVSLAGPATNTGAAAGDTYTGIEGIIGGAGADRITGNSSRNYLFGGEGNDSLRGAGGNDYLNGGNGGDQLYGGLGADQHVGGDDAGIDYARYDDGNYGNLIINLGNPGVNTGAAAGDTYVGIEGIAGGAGNDTIVGDSLRNYLYGLGGQDKLDGRGGNDVLVGGAGARDDFRFTTALGAGNVDRITDFEPGVDKIALSRAIFTDIGTTLTANEFGASADPDNYIIYNQGTGKLFYDGGGSGGGPGPVVFATVAAGTVLDVNDFLMIA
jgi:Ca2+-binding RTX toxin-like protein